MGGWDDIGYYEEEAAQAEFIQETLRNISEDGVRNYLGTYGDAVDKRISDCMQQAADMQYLEYFQPAMILAVTAVELIIQFLLIRPLMQAAFLSEEWANLLTQRIAAGQTANDREILPQILRFHDIDLASVKLRSGKLLWPTITHVYKKRNDVVHRAEPVSRDESATAIECAKHLRKQVVMPFAEKLGFTLELTGTWHHSKTENMGAHYNTRDPFSDKSTLPLAPEIPVKKGTQ